MKTLTRRAFLQKSLAGAGLTIAVSLTPFGTKLLSAAEIEKEEGLFSPNVWLQVTTRNAVNIIVNKSEMGQGVYTSLPMIAADELDADWKQVRLKVAPAADKYKDPAWGRQLTGGSTSIRHMFDPLRKAGAAAREMLVEAAAGTWGVPASECEASSGSVRHVATKREISFGDLALKASKLPVPQNPVLKKESMFNFIGRPMDRLDIPAKAHGTAQFGIDTFVPEMLYAAIERPPAYGAKPLSYDRNAAMKIKGVSHVLQLPGGVGERGFEDQMGQGDRARYGQRDPPKGIHPGP
jgi:isoquinoline 1-oxidoreductase beta subunit